MHTDKNKRTPKKLRTIKQFSALNPAFTKSSLEWLIFNAKTNGLSDFNAVIRIGGRVYIEEDFFFDWVAFINNMRQA